MALIKCKECGQDISDKAVSCPKCGAPVEKMVICSECGKEMKETAQACPNCGCPNPKYHISAAYTNPQSKADNIFNEGPSGKSRGIFAILALFLGCLGIHYFYIGKNGPGIMSVLIVLLGWILLYIPLIIIAVISIIQGVLALIMSQEEFEKRYVYSNSFIPF